MEAVGDLHGVRSTLARPFGVGSSAISTGDLHPWMRTEPHGECGSLAVGQQGDHAVAFQIDEHGAVALAAAERPVVHPEHARRQDLGGAGGSGGRLAPASEHGPGRTCQAESVVVIVIRSPPTVSCSTRSSVLDGQNGDVSGTRHLCGRGNPGG